MSRLNNTARQQLAAIVMLEGLKLAEDERLCEAFLRDYCAECRLEIACLVAAVRWGVPRSLKEGQLVPPVTLRANLARRLQENHGLEENAAVWAVDSWALVVRPDSWCNPEAETFVQQGHYDPPAQPLPIPAPPQPSTRPTPISSGPEEHNPLQVYQAIHPLDYAPEYPPVSPPVYQPARPVSVPAPPPAIGYAVEGAYAAAGRAFVNGEKSPELDFLLKYLSTQIKKKPQAVLIEEVKAGGVPAGTARDLVVKVRRRRAAKKLGIGTAAVLFGFVVAFSAVSGGGTPNGGLSFLSLLLITLGALYSLYSAVLLIRLS